MTGVLGVVLAGGQARRMAGQDKATLTLGGQTLLSRAVTRLAPQVDLIAINANGDTSRFEEYKRPVISDTVKGFAGPLAGILAGLDWAAELGAGAIVTVAVDTPFFPDNLVETFLSTHKPLVLAASIDAEHGRLRQPTFGLWSVQYREELRQALEAGTRKVVAFTDQHQAGIVGFSATPFDPFFNVNTPEDMIAAETLLKEVNP